MNLINWLKKLFKNSNPIENKKIERDNSIKKHITNISFVLADNDNIDIICSLPDIKNKNPEEIAEEAEKFAEVLLCINEGLFKNEIVNILNEKHKTENDPIQKLLIENVLNFWLLLNDHYKKEKNKLDKKRAKTPLIRPLLVFSNRK